MSHRSRVRAPRGMLCALCVAETIRDTLLIVAIHAAIRKKCFRRRARGSRGRCSNKIEHRGNTSVRQFGMNPFICKTRRLLNCWHLNVYYIRKTLLTFAPYAKTLPQPRNGIFIVMVPPRAQRQVGHAYGKRCNSLEHFRPRGS
jgi:hypothetical protein